jgi:hypothetical protein
MLKVAFLMNTVAAVLRGQLGNVSLADEGEDEDEHGSCALPQI